MDLTEIRRTVIRALCSDDVLMERLVLKGGNALSLIYGVGGRASLDLDYSIEGDVEDLTAFKARIDTVVAKAFAQHGLAAFDQKLELRPLLRDGMTMHPNWGGYQYSFKLIAQDLRGKLQGDLQKMRSQAVEVSPGQKRTFTVDISRFEACPEKEAHEFDQLQLFVYSPAMLLAEKLRAICQQNPDYSLRGHPAPRARDFFDIHTIATKLGVDGTTERFAELVRIVFSAKMVPLDYLKSVGESREFHRTDWPAVEASIAEKHEGYDVYFDFVLRLIERIPLG